jgi:hypothetical protein
MFPTLILLAMYGNLGILASTSLHGRDTCAPCDPSGVRTTVAPSIGTDDLGKFYESLLISVKGIQFSQRSSLDGDTILQRRAAPICCKSPPRGMYSSVSTLTFSGAQLTECLLLPDAGLPFCYVSFSALIDCCRLLTFVGQIHHFFLPT